MQELVKTAHQVAQKLLANGRVTMNDSAAIELTEWVRYHSEEVTAAYSNKHIDHKGCAVCNPASGTGNHG